jgi:hypothetical protein
MNQWEFVVAIGGLVVNLLAAVIGGTWVLSKNNTKLLGKFYKQLDLERREIDIKIENVAHYFGESVSAIRTKVTEVELWNRDNLASKTTFQQVIADFRSTLQRFEDKLDKRLGRIESKLDDKPNRVSPDDGE